MSGEDEFDLVGNKRLFDRSDDAKNEFVTMLSSPRGPAFHFCFEIRNDDGAIGDGIAKESGLRADVLDVEMPVVAGFQFLADGLCGGVAVGQRVKDEQHGFVRREIFGGRRIDLKPYGLVFLKERLKKKPD